MTARRAEEIVPTLKGMTSEELKEAVAQSMQLLEVQVPPTSLAAQYAARDAKIIYQLFLEYPIKLFAADVLSRLEDFVVFYAREQKKD